MPLKLKFVNDVSAVYIVSFAYSERLGYNKQDNLINYFCGPFKIELECWSEKK